VYGVKRHSDGTPPYAREAKFPDGLNILGQSDDSRTLSRVVSDRKVRRKWNWRPERVLNAPENGRHRSGKWPDQTGKALVNRLAGRPASCGKTAPGSRPHPGAIRALIRGAREPARLGHLCKRGFCDDFRDCTRRSGPGSQVSFAAHKMVATLFSNFSGSWRRFSGAAGHFPEQ
jgi:hypothetical protein